MPQDRDYENRSASDRSAFGYIVLLMVGIGVGAVILYDLRDGPSNTIEPQQAAPGSPSAPVPQSPTTGPGVPPLP